MESIAIDAKTNLAGQTAQMQRMHGKLAEVGGEASHANATMGQIKRARSVNRWVMYGVGALVAVAVAIVVASRVI